MKRRRLTVNVICVAFTVCLALSAFAADPKLDPTKSLVRAPEETETTREDGGELSAWHRTEAKSPDGTILASVEDDCTVVLRDAPSGRKIASLYKPSRMCRGYSDGEPQPQVRSRPWVSFSPDGRLLAIDLGGYGMLDLWIVQDRRRVASFNGLGHIRSLQFLQDSRLILVVGFEGKVFHLNRIAVLDVATGKELFQAEGTAQEGFKKVALSPDGKMVMAQVGPGKDRPDGVKLWDIRCPYVPVTLKGQSAEFLPDGKLLLFTRTGRSIVWDIKAVKVSPAEEMTESPRPARSFTSDHIAQSIGDDKWKWTVFLRGHRQDIGDIKCVEYRLHPTFPNPVRRVCDIGDSMRPFALSATGWGTFTIPIRVFMKDGTHQDLKHELKF